MKTLLIWLGCLFVLSVMPIRAPYYIVSFGDVVVHMFLYAITCALFYVVLKEHGTASGRVASMRFNLLLAVVLSAGYGFSMELVQGLTENRTFSYSDAVANLVGAALAAAYIIRRERKRPAKAGGPRAGS